MSALVPTITLERPAPTGLSVGAIVRAHLPALLAADAFGSSERRALGAMAACKTGALGGRVEVCEACGAVTMRAFSCRNRHCPSCQTRAQFAWVEQRMERVLDVPHFHLVFTLPSELRALARANPRIVYDALMQAAGDAVLTLAADPVHLGALPTITAVLHTWTRELGYHPHVHLLVSGGGLVSDSGTWKSAKPRYFLPVKALSKFMRGAMRERILRAARRGEIHLGEHASADEARLRRGLFEAKWVVYAKAPFGDARAVFAYLGKYTHRVGISNRRLDTYDGERVTFATKHGGHLTLDASEFVRRLAMHVLPRGFHKIRHLGLAAPARIHRELPRARAAIAALEAAKPALRSDVVTTTVRSVATTRCETEIGRCPDCDELHSVRVVAVWLRGHVPDSPVAWRIDSS